MSFFESTSELIIVQKEKKTRADANALIEIEKTTFHRIETEENHSNVWIWLYTFYYIYLSIISTASRLYDVLKTRSVVFVSFAADIRLIASAHQSNDSYFRNQLKCTHYDEITSVNCYTFSNNSKPCKKRNNLIILISDKFSQFIIQSQSISNHWTSFERWI